MRCLSRARREQSQWWSVHICRWRGGTSCAVCCESQSACHGVMRWSRAVPRPRPRGPPTVRQRAAGASARSSKVYPLSARAQSASRASRALYESRYEYDPGIPQGIPAARRCRWSYGTVDGRLALPVHAVRSVCRCMKMHKMKNERNQTRNMSAPRCAGRCGTVSPVPRSDRVFNIYDSPTPCDHTSRTDPGRDPPRPTTTSRL